MQRVQLHLLAVLFLGFFLLVIGGSLMWMAVFLGLRAMLVLNG
jgi:hypothetical protein